MQTSSTYRSSSTTTPPDNGISQRSFKYGFAFNLKPTLEPWIKAGVPSEMREKAAHRLDSMWWEDLTNTSLDLSDLPLRDLPETLKKFPNLKLLRVRGDTLRDLSNTFLLPTFCRVELVGELAPQIASQLHDAYSDPNYKGPKFITSDVVPEKAQASSSTSKGKALQYPDEEPRTSPYSSTTYNNDVSRRLSIGKGDVFISQPIPLELSIWRDAGLPAEMRAQAFERITNCSDLPKLINALDLSDLPLRSLPTTVGELGDLKKLQIQGTHLDDLSPIFNLPKDCEIYISGELNKELFNKTEALTNDLEYSGPTLFVAIPKVVVQERKAIAEAKNALQQLAEAAEQKKLRARTLAMFKKRCDICYKPASQSSDIVLPKKCVLQWTPLIHEKCLVDQFPLRADENLSLKSRRWFNPRITLDALKKSMSSIEQMQRNSSPYLQVIQSLLTDRDATLSSQQKMDLFLRATDYLGSGKRLQVGNRSLSKTACITRALELALQSSPEKIPHISKLLLEEMPTGTLKFLISGISYNRYQLEDWSMNRNRPGESRNDAMAAKLEKLMHEKSEIKRKENVEVGTVRKAAMARLDLIIERVVDLRDITQVKQSIQQYIQVNSRNQKDALAGLKIVANNNEKPSYFKHRVHEALAIVWSYIEDTRSEELKTNLKDALVARLIEVAVEEREVNIGDEIKILPPCPNGQIQRLIDVPEGIDFSICSGLSIEQLKEELSQLAGGINSEFEEEWGNYADQLRKNFSNKPSSHKGNSTNDADPDLIISEIKRDMFFAKVKAILIEQRGLDPDIVLREAKLTFPEGIVL